MEDSEDRIERLARTLYFNHMKLNERSYAFMWKQCYPEYREAWREIAKGQLANG